jgi:hypothetical protein
MLFAVIPAKAGIQSHMRIALSPWAPAFAGVTMNRSDA